MPTMPRIDNKSKKIAYAILGKPANMDDKKTQEQSKIDKRLNFEETIRVR